MVGSAANVAGDYTWAPLEVSVTGNRVDSSGLTAGTAVYGIAFTGAYAVTVQEYATGIIADNIVQDYGDEDVATGCAVYCHTTKGLKIHGNKIIRAGKSGMLLSFENVEISVSDNTVLDPWSETNAVACIYFNDINNTGFIGGNTFAANQYTGGVKTFELTLSSGRGVYFATATGTLFTIGENYSEAGIYIDDGFGVSVRGMTGVATSGTGEDDLCSQVFPANAVGVGDRLRFTGAGSKAGAGGQKTIKFYFGSTSITLFDSAAPNIGDWHFQIVVMMSSNVVQRLHYFGFDGTTVIQGYATPTETLTTGFTAKFTGECANAGDTITQLLWFVEKF
jgi:hypothetical protein